jgi:NAD+ synthase (glutamine-hydrolysing)
MSTLITIAQIEIVPARPDLNYAKMVDCVDSIIKSSSSVTMIVFPELTIPGYLLGDMWEEKTFITDCIWYGDKVRELALKYKVNIAFGNVGVTKNDSTYTDGRIEKFNGLFIASHEGDFLVAPSLANIGFNFTPKTLLPNYREFEEPRHFSDLIKVAANEGCAASELIEPIDIQMPQNPSQVYSIGFTLCEDGWDADYNVKPIKTLCDQGAELIVNMSCSPFTVGKNHKRNRVFSAHASANSVPVLYANAIGSQNNGKTIYTFDGSSVVYDSEGEILAQLPYFTEGVLPIKLITGSDEVLSVRSESGGDVNPSTEIHEIYEALKYGIKTYMKQCGLNRVVIGSSGGIDSAVAAALYAEVIGPENLLLVNMPSNFNSETTKGLSAQLGANLGCLYGVTEIGPSVELTMRQVNGKEVSGKVGKMQLQLSKFDMENVQARDRSSRILAAYASAFGGVFTNNGNKSEATVGYCTLYGDHAGFLAAIGDLWKHQVYKLGRYINYVNQGEVIPQGIFNIPASAELSLEQSIDGDGDPLKYWYHDKLFKSWIENWDRITPTEILHWYMVGELEEKLDIEMTEFGGRRSVTEIFKTANEFIDDLEKWWKLFKGMGAAKRVQSPPVIAVSKRAFGFDYRECVNGVYYSRKYLELRQQLYKVKPTP